MKKQKVVLFDIDNTLFDTTGFRQRLYRSVAKVLDYDVKLLSETGQNITCGFLIHMSLPCGLL